MIRVVSGIDSNQTRTLLNITPSRMAMLDFTSSISFNYESIILECLVAGEKSIPHTPTRNMSGLEPISWSFGLRNAEGFYLTAETFGFSVNCTAKVMKKKQIFFLEQNGKDVFIKS